MVAPMLQSYGQYAHLVTDTEHGSGLADLYPAMKGVSEARRRLDASRKPAPIAANFPHGCISVTKKLWKVIFDGEGTILRPG